MATRKIILTVSAAEHARFVEAARVNKQPLHQWAIQVLREAESRSAALPKGKTLMEVFSEESESEKALRRGKLILEMICHDGAKHYLTPEVVKAKERELALRVIHDI